jgi:ribosomal protein S18 acetylase RimI-like enzyme
MNVVIHPMPLEGPRFEAAMRVYGAAFAPPPYSDPARGREVRQRILDVHSARKGFAGFVACAPNGDVVGMIYGYHGAPGQWWHDAVVRAVDRNLAAQWFADSYELVEVAVDPKFQGHGVGQMLIASLLEGRTEATCVLSTRTDSRAHHLYRRLGFEVINVMRFSPNGARFFVMGRPLPYLESASPVSSSGQEAASLS